VTAAKLGSGDAWRRGGPPRNSIRSRDARRRGRQQLDELLKFLRRQGVVTLPDAEAVVVAPSPEFYRWAFASMWTPGPFETKASRAYYYLTDALPSWPPNGSTNTARLQRAHAVEHLDSRGYPGIRALPVPAQA
jgi:hypothetical protein